MSTSSAGAAARLPEDHALLPVRQLHAVGHPAVHPDGRAGRARRAGARPVRGGDGAGRPPARRAGDGGDRRLRRLRRDLRLLGRDHRHLRPRGAAGAAALSATTPASPTGTIAVGGTLGILIPPSVILVVYAITTEQNIAKLFMAALIPGLLAALLLHRRDRRAWCGATRRSRRRRTARRARRAPRRRCCSVWPVLLIALVVVGGIYGGVFTPTEGAAVGALAMLLVGLAAAARCAGAEIRQALMPDRRDHGDDLHHPARRRGVQRLPGAVAGCRTCWPLWVIASRASRPMACWSRSCSFYILLGAVMDELAMILLTLPVFFPVVHGARFRPDRRRRRRSGSASWC